MVQKKFFSSISLSNKVFIFLIILRVFWLFFSNLSLYTTPYNQTEALDKYYQSSYIRGDKSDITLSDAELYSVEGYLLIDKHFDLENLTPGHPPFAKYLIGLSIAIFHNPLFSSFIAFCLFLFSIYLISQSPLLVLLLSFEPLFVSQIKESLLDLWLVSFHLFSLYFFLKFLSSSQKNTKPLILSLSLIGLSFATKFFPVTMPLLALYFLLIIIKGSFSHFKKFIIYLPFIGLSFCLGHISYFFYHPSLIQFAKYFRYTLNWWAGSPQVPPFAVWLVIFRNQWPTWWGEGTIPVPNWWLVWPIITGFSLIFGIYGKKIYLWLFLIINLTFLSFQAIFPRHLLTLLPACYLISYFTIKRMIAHISKKPVIGKSTRV